jgi:hypothetical protein
MRLHIITGDLAMAKAEASARQNAEPELNWLIYTAPNAGSLPNYIDSRNVIWVATSAPPLEVTTSHCVALPTTFGSVVRAHVEGGPDRLFVLVASELLVGGRWLDGGGVSHLPHQLLEPTVLFDAKEA